jgi:hypothetical protein
MKLFILEITGGAMWVTTHGTAIVVAENAKRAKDLVDARSARVKRSVEVGDMPEQVLFKSELRR